MCLAHALKIAMTKVNSDSKYESYRDGKGLKKPVEELLKASGVDLSNGGGLKNFNSFRSTFRITKLLCLMVYSQIASSLAEIPFRPRNYIYYMIGNLGIII